MNTSSNEMRALASNCSQWSTLSVTLLKSDTSERFTSLYLCNGDPGLLITSIDHTTLHPLSSSPPPPLTYIPVYLMHIQYTVSTLCRLDIRKSENMTSNKLPFTQTT